MVRALGQPSLQAALTSLEFDLTEGFRVSGLSSGLSLRLSLEQNRSTNAMQLASPSHDGSGT